MIGVSLTLAGDLDNAEVLPDGTRILYAATITEPPEYAGQVRDVILHSDGSVALGRDLARDDAT